MSNLSSIQKALIDKEKQAEVEEMIKAGLMNDGGCLNLTSLGRGRLNSIYLLKSWKEMVAFADEINNGEKGTE